MNTRFHCTIGCTVLFLCILVMTSAKAQLFEPSVEYGVGGDPAAIASEDFNNDGYPDLVTANYLSDDVSVLLGNGDGTFGPAVSFGAGDEPRSVAAGDLDGDGNPDVVVTNLGSDNVSVLMGNGNGTFQAAVNYEAGYDPYSVAIGFLNGDGHQDLAVTNKYGNNVSILLGAGDGTFGSDTTFDTGTDPYAVSIGHLNGDGLPDLVVANREDDTISVLLGNGDGTFQSAVHYPAGDRPYSVPIADLDGDGFNDLAVANAWSDNVSVFLGYGDGTFQAAANYIVGDSPHSVSVSDLNGDSNLDLSVANVLSGDISVLLGNGDGTFQAALTFTAGEWPYAVVSEDLDGDGDPDLAVPNRHSDNVSIFINSAATVWIVDQAGGGDFTVIQDCIDAAASGDLCLVKPGVYIENINYIGKDVTLRSDLDGNPWTLDISPETTIIDGNAAGPVVTLESGETSNAVLDGFTIQNGDNGGYTGAGVHCDLAAATIKNCIVIENDGYDIGTEHTIPSDRVVITDSEISSMVMIDDTEASIIGSDILGGLYIEDVRQIEFQNTVISGEIRSYSGGSVNIVECEIKSIIRNEYGMEYDISNSSLKGINFDRYGQVSCYDCSIDGGGYISLWVLADGYFRDCYISVNFLEVNDQSGLDLVNCVIESDNGIGAGGDPDSSLGMYGCTIRVPSLYVASGCSAEINSCIIWDAFGESIPDIYVSEWGTLSITYSDIQMENPEDVWPGTGNINANPLFVPGPEGCYYLSQVAAGQSANSPCVDAGGSPAGASGTTRTDHVGDSGVVDMGYHHGTGMIVPCPATIAADFTCTPSSGTLPFSTLMSATLSNIYSGQIRRIAGHIDITLASGGYFPSWRAGFTNVAAGSSFIRNWSQNLPSLGALVGDNLFELVVEDVTPAPYNQPPYPAAGSTDTSICTVVGNVNY